MDQDRRRGAPGGLVLVRPAATDASRVVLDDAQRAVVAHRRGAGPLVVLGAPGTGRTTTLLEALAARVERDGADPASLLLLAPTRTSAAALRDRLSSRLGRTTTQALARTPHAYAWGLLRRAAVLAGRPAPRLLSGPEQDSLIADLLRGHAAGAGTPPQWPASVPEATRRLRGFRAELRDLLMRALERGVTPARLAELGRAHGRPEWVAAATLMREYLQVTALASPEAHDPAAIVRDAARLLADDPVLLAEERARWSLVAVEDHQESTAATAALLDLVAGSGADLLLVGDPDATTSTFRGADPALLAAAPARYRRADGAAAATVVLGTRWRCGEELSAAAVRVGARIGSSGATAHRCPRASPALPAGLDDGTGGVEGHVVRSAAQQSALVAALLRAEHLQRRTPWSAMAVVVRSAGSTGSLRRALAAAGVPVAVPVAEVPVRDEPAVQPLRTALRVSLRLAAAAADPPAPDESPGRLPGQSPRADDVLELLGSWLGGADALGVRRLRQALLALERAAGGTRPSDQLLVHAVTRPEVLAQLPPRAGAPARAVARVLAAGREAAGDRSATAEDVLWALWSAAGVAEGWRRTALGGGPSGARADRDLDAVMALFDAAARYEDRLPGSPPGRFLEHLESQDLPSDTLAARSQGDEAVALVTAQGALGREWQVVVVPGLQEGAWPDTRLRGTLLGAPDLVDLLAGRAVELPAQEAAVAARRQVLDDERRLLHVAVTRARRRLVVTAVDSEEEQPSSFLDLVAPPEGGRGEARSPTRVPRPLTLPALVAELRAVLLTPAGHRDATGARIDAGRHAEAAEQLARLAAAGVPGAAPEEWHGLMALSDDAPLVADGEPVPVSPSAVESFERCGLRWVLETRGGRAAASVRQGIGVLVHQVAEEVRDGDEAAMQARLEQLWPTLGLPETWVGARELRRARRMVAKLAAYVAHARAQGREVVGVEVEVEAALGRALVRGRLDRVERDADGRLRVVDLKTGSRPPAAADLPEHPQLGLYQAVVEAGALDGLAGPAEPPGSAGAPGDGEARSGGAALVQLGHDKAKGFGEQQQPALSAAPDPGWARRLVEETAEAMASSAFVAEQNAGCGTCPVRTCCPLRPEGRAVAPAVPPAVPPADPPAAGGGLSR